MPADRRIAARMGLGALSGYAWAMLSARALTRGFGHLTSVARQVAELIRSGAVVTVIEPDAAAVKAIGRNVLDPARRRPWPGALSRQRLRIRHQSRGSPPDRRQLQRLRMLSSLRMLSRRRASAACF